MKNKLIRVVLPLLIWISVWQILSLIISNEYLLPGIPSTITALGALLSEFSFYKAVLFSALRVLAGLILGIVLGIGIGVACKKFYYVDAIFAPVISIIKSTPVASFIVLLWVLMSGDALSVFIGFLMVLPLIWQSTVDSINSIDKDTMEVAKVFEFSMMRKIKLIFLPTLKRFLVPAVISATGLAWKAEIAAEIIAYTKKSIGQGINDAKYNMDTPTVFAWTIVIVTSSILLESVAIRMLRRIK